MASRREEHTTRQHFQFSVMSSKQEIIEQFMLAFLNSLYDDWILRPWSQPAACVNARTVRALEAAVGRNSIESCFEQLEKKERIRIIKAYENADGNDTVLEILDYVS